MTPPKTQRQAPAPDRRVAAARARVERLAGLLDGSLRLPGTRFTFGLDSLIGLIPGIGDLASALLGAGILLESLRLGAPPPLLARMLGNLALDGLLGAVPVAGDVFDFAYKSHARNARLLLEHLDTQAPAVTPAAVTLRAHLGVVLAVLLLGAIPILSVYGLYRLLQ